MSRRILLFSGYGAGEKTLTGLEAALSGLAKVRVMSEGVGVSQARDGYTYLRRDSDYITVVGVGDGCIQALLIAEAFPVEALACVLPDSGRQKGRLSDRLSALNNLFAVVAPALVADREESRMGRRIYRRLRPDIRRFLPVTEKDRSAEAVAEELSRILTNI